MILLMLSVSGCSNKAMYNKLRQDERYKCNKQPTTAYFECIERTSKAYEEYDLERKELIENHQN